MYIFIRGKKPVFRKELYPLYKANREKPSELVGKLYDYAKIAHQAIECDGYEAEDFVYSFSKKLEHNGLILYIDHDILEIPSLMMNYQSFEYKKISPELALYNKYKKLILSEPGDNVQLTKGLGLVYFEKNFHIDMSIEEYEKATYSAFLKAHRDVKIVGKKKVYTENPEKAKEMLELAKKLIWLKDIYEE